MVVRIGYGKTNVETDGKEHVSLPTGNSDSLCLAAYIFTIFRLQLLTNSNPPALDVKQYFRYINDFSSPY